MRRLWWFMQRAQKRPSERRIDSKDKSVRMNALFFGCYYVKKEQG